MKQLYTIIFLAISLNLWAQDQCEPIGWATENGGVTGGGSATPVVVSTYSELANAIGNETPAIHISGTITFNSGDRITIQDLSNMTIFGLPGAKLVSTDLTKSGSGIFYIKRVTNLIIQNVTFEGPGAYDADGYDNLCIDNCQNVWVDHCDFQDGMDGNFDIKNMSDYVSVTWCIFQYKKAPISGGSGGSNDHRYTNLIGSSATAYNDSTHLNTTFQYCWWGDGCRERMPRVRFGKIHLLNNYFSSSVSNYCARAGEKANIRIEGCYFDNQNNPVDLYKSSAIVSENNNISTKGSIKTQKASGVFTPPYLYSVADPSTIITPIKSCAGATLSGWGACSDCEIGGNRKPVVTISSPVDGASYATGTTVTIKNTATDPNGSVENVFYYLDGQEIHQEWIAPYDFDYEFTTEGTFVLKAVATDNEGATTEKSITINISSPYTVTVGTAGAAGALSEDVSGTYYSGDEISVKAIAYIGTEFTGWTGGVTGSNKTLTFSVDGNIDVTANFAVAAGATKYEFEDGYWENATAKFEDQHTGFTGTGYVNTENEADTWTELTVYAQSAGTFNCEIHYAATDDRPINVSVNGSEQISNHAMPPTAEWFEWATTTFTLDLVEGENTIRVTGPTDQKGAPNLDWISFQSGTPTTYFDLTVTQPTNGTISPSSGSYAEGTEVTLTATPAQGYVFSEWSGDASGSTNPVTIAISKDMSVSAVFVEDLTPKDVSLKEGWNLVGYPYEGSEGIETALQSVWDNIEVVKNDEGFYHKDYPAYLKSLQKLEWAKGYFIKVSDDCKLIWP